MKRKNMIVLFVIMLTVFYAVAAFSLYQSEMNSVKGWYSYRVEQVHDKAVGDLKYYSDPEYFVSFNESFDVEPKEYDFEQAMCELTTNSDFYKVYKDDIPTVEVEAVFDSKGNIVAKEGMFYKKAVKYSETVEQTNDKQINRLEELLKEYCEDEPELQDIGVLWTTGDNCNYILLEFEYNSEKYFFYAGVGLDFVKATLGSETFVKAVAYISVCYAAFVVLSFALFSIKRNKDNCLKED